MSGPVEGSSVTRWRTRRLFEPAAADGGRGDPRPWLVHGRLQGREAVVDLAPVVAMTCLALPQLVHHARYSDPRLGLYVVLSVVLIASLTVRRRLPLSVLALFLVLMLTQAWVGIQLIAGTGLLIAVYSVASRYPLRVAGPSCVMAVATTVPAASQVTHGFGWIDLVVIVSAVVLASLMCGAYVRDRAATIRALTEAADQLARERAQHAQLAVARERAQIAREMHDIIAHSLSVMVALADAAALKVPAHPHEAAATMGRVSDVGRQALGDSRRVLGVLRGDATVPLTPQPGVDDLEVLVEQVHHDGLDAVLTVTGPVAAVPAAAGLTVYRIAQEATANTLKHARGTTRLDVSLTITRTTVTLHVHDDGQAEVAASSTPPRGNGIQGMRERAAAYGGTVTAGPGPDGGWDVRAELPLTARGRRGEDRA